MVLASSHRRPCERGVLSALADEQIRVQQGASEPSKVSLRVRPKAGPGAKVSGLCLVGLKALSTPDFLHCSPTASTTTMLTLTATVY